MLHLIEYFEGDHSADNVKFRDDFFYNFQIILHKQQQTCCCRPNVRRSWRDVSQTAPTWSTETCSRPSCWTDQESHCHLISYTTQPESRTSGRMVDAGELSSCSSSYWHTAFQRLKFHKSAPEPTTTCWRADVCTVPTPPSTTDHRSLRRLYETINNKRSK